MGGIHMHMTKLHLCVDGRYAINHYPGIGRVATMLCHAWATHPHIRRLDIITNRNARNDLFVLPSNSPHVHVHALDAKPFGWREWRQMGTILNQLHADWTYAPYVWMPPHVRGTQRLLTVHDAIPMAHTHMHWARRIVFKQLVKFSMVRANVITTVSHHAATQIEQYYDYHDGIDVIPNGVSPLFFHAPSPETLASLGITQPYVLCVSSNQPHKNLTGLLDAWSIAYGTGVIPASSQLVIAGHVDTQRAQPWTDARYAQLPIIHVSDPADTVLNQLYHHAHLCVFPSLAEGFGLPVIEALAAHNVVLCHDYPTFHELHGDIVHYTDMQHPHTVAQVMTQLWHNEELRNSMKRRAQPHAQRFGWAHIANRYVELMQNTPISA